MSLARVQLLADTYGPPVYPLPSETEPDGNAFAMLATWRRTALDWGWPESAVSEVCREATSGDYQHLRQTFEVATGRTEIVAEWPSGRRLR